jgi:hypothetical protein
LGQQGGNEMMNFSLSLLVYLIIGLLIAAYNTLTSPPFDEEDKELWNEHGMDKHMDFPKKPKLFFFCLISLVWPLHLIVQGKRRK